MSDPAFNTIDIADRLNDIARQMNILGHAMIGIAYEPREEDTRAGDAAEVANQTHDLADDLRKVRELIHPENAPGQQEPSTDSLLGLIREYRRQCEVYNLVAPVTEEQCKALADAGYVRVAEEITQGVKAGTVKATTAEGALAAFDALRENKAGENVDFLTDDLEEALVAAVRDFLKKGGAS